MITKSADGEARLPVFEEVKQGNEEAKSGLIQEYGSQEFYNCFECEEYYEINPFLLRACLHEARLCLENTAAGKEECGSGETWSHGRCVSVDVGCKERFGPQSYYSLVQKDENYICNCHSGFGWNQDQSYCIQTDCQDGDVYYREYRSRDGSFLNGRCMSADEACRSEFGDNAVFSRIESGDYYCACAGGWEWNAEMSECSEAIEVLGITNLGFDEEVYERTIEQEKNLTQNIDPALSSKLAGRILLQVEEHGEAWYVSPVDHKRYFLSSPYKALEIMSELGLGARHDFLVSHAIYPTRVSGWILLDVEINGEAYYIYPQNRRPYYLGSPEMAYEVMRDLGLGISNKDIRKIEIGITNAE